MMMQIVIVFQLKIDLIQFILFLGRLMVIF